MMTQKNDISAWNYFQMQKNDALGESRRNLNEANQTERELNSQLILVATVNIGVVGAILAGSVYVGGITIAQSVFATSGILFGLLSIFSGIVHYVNIIAFNGKWAFSQREIGRKYEEMSLAKDKPTLSNLGDELNSFIGTLPEKSNQAWLYAEFLFVFLSGLSLILMIIAVVFDWRTVLIFFGQ